MNSERQKIVVDSIVNLQQRVKTLEQTCLALNDAVQTLQRIAEMQLAKNRELAK